MLRGQLAAGGDKRSCGGKDDLCALVHGLFHDGVDIAVGLKVVDADGDLAAHGLLHGAAAQVVPGYPVAVDGVRPVYEGDAYVVRHKYGAEDAVEYALGRGLCRVVDADLDRLCLGLGLEVGPDGGERLAYLGDGELLDGADGVEVEPDEQGVGNGDAEFFAAELDEGLLEEVEGGLKAAALLLGPDVVRVVAEVGLELGKAPAAAEVDLIDAAPGR